MTLPAASNASPRCRPEADLKESVLFRRLLLIALLLEAGLLLALAPWSSFWDRNYFVQLVPGLAPVVTSNYVRGAVTGLGLVNLWAAAGELAELFDRRASPGPQ